MPLTSMATALNHALADAMAEDDQVLVFGEDVAALGGVFRITDGLTARFGDDRCFDTPLAESGIVGTAIGMAMYGFRPVVEMQFDAFAYPAFEQVTSHLAKMHNRTKGRVTLPIVVRLPYGGGIGGVEHHCESSESYYVHTPGLKVVVPFTPADAYSMLRAAIASDDPVIFMEPKQRYWARDDLELPVETEPLHQAVVRRPGSTATVIAYGGAVGTAMEAAEAAVEEGWDLEVIDLRSLSPLDEDTVVASVMRTGRALVVHEAPTFGGFGAEVAARITELAFHHLEAPVLRVGGFDIPYPPPKLERFFLPDVDRILDTVEQLQPT